MVLARQTGDSWVRPQGLYYWQHGRQHEIHICLGSSCAWSYEGDVWDAGGCCIYRGLCQAEELLGFRNPFYKKSSSKLLQPCSEGRNHFYFTGQEINLLSSQEGDTTSQGSFGRSPSILGNSLEQKLTQEAQKHHVEFYSNTLQLKNQLK